MAAHPHFLWTDLFRRQKSEQSSLIEALKDNVLFSTLNARELSYLARMVYERVYQQDENIFHQNDRGFGMYLIVKGRVAIKTMRHDGEVLVTTLGKGSFFGELSLVDPENIRTATAAASERTVLAGFFKPDLLEILERKPAMGVKILHQLSTVLGRRLLETTEKITLLTQARGIEKVHGQVF
ncbi:MAG: cyclic nucleotide-binding domain-containing protein [Bacteriovoracia bacterium]